MFGFERKSMRGIALIAAVLLALCAWSGAVAENMTVYAAEGAVVYDVTGTALGVLSAGTELTLTGVKGNVCRVEKDGKTAYMKKADLSAQKAADGAEKCVTAYVSTDGAVVYDGKGRARTTLAMNTEVSVTGKKGAVCRVSANGKTGYMSASDLSCEKAAASSRQAVPTAPAKGDGISTVTPAKGSAREMDWWESDIQTIFARGVVAQITDVETGLSWREKRFGGTNHADCQPLTAADTAAMKKAYGGKWSWDRRAVFVTIDGVNYAASINGMPHGGGSITDNDFNGHHCIHFTNSRTHGTNRVCPLHQAAIKQAAMTTM